MSIHLLGTSHISPESARAAERLIDSGAYGVVALELDRQRLHAVLQPEAQETPGFLALVRAVGLWGALFAKLGKWVEHKLGARIGMTPGAEMRAAALAAGIRKIPLALIDQPIQRTLRRFSQEFTWKARLKIIPRLFRRTSIKSFDLQKAPDQETVEQLIKEFRRFSPELTRVLIDERNHRMVAALKRVQAQHQDEDILALVGAGHVPGMHELLVAAGLNTRILSSTP